VTSSGSINVQVWMFSDVAGSFPSMKACPHFKRYLLFRHYMPSKLPEKWDICCSPVYIMQRSKSWSC